MKELKNKSRILNAITNKKIIVIWPIGIYVDKRVLKYEKVTANIIWEQQKELLGVFYFIWYSVEWAIKKSYFIYLRVKKPATEAVSLQKEIDKNYVYKNYTKYRKRYNWLKYI